MAVCIRCGAETDDPAHVCAPVELGENPERDPFEAAGRVDDPNGVSTVWVDRLAARRPEAQLDLDRPGALDD